MKPFLFYCLLLLLLPLCTRAQQPVITPHGMALPVVNVEVEEVALTGTRVPDVCVTDVSGKSWLLGQLRGKVVFLYCFALDSLKHGNAAAEVNYLAGKYTDSSAVFLALTPDVFSPMAQCNGGNAAFKCPVAYQQGAALQKLAINTFPSVIVLNKRGRVALWQDAGHAGGLAEQEALLCRLLRK